MTARPWRRIAVAHRPHHITQRRAAAAAFGGAAAGSSGGFHHGSRKIYRAFERLCPVGARLGIAQRPSAPVAGAPVEGAAGRQGRAVRQSDPRRRRRPRGGAGAGRCRARQAAEGRGQRRRAGLYEPGTGAHLRPGREDRREGRRQLRHGRAPALGIGDGERHAVGQGAG